MSLYTIEEELLSIFAAIEENEGEITEELATQLNFTQENLKEKLGNYVRAIRSWEAEAEIAKAEIKKLAANATVKSNRVERLKKAMLGAVQLFGMDGKSGNKVIDLPTYKLFTKGSKATVVDDKRINILIGEFERFIRELAGSGILYTGSDVELQGILDSINANLKAEWDTDIDREIGSLGLQVYTPYTLSDLTTIKLKISTTQSIYDLFRTGKEAIFMYTNNPINSTINDSTPKDDWKTAIGIADVMNEKVEEVELKYSYPSVAKIIENTSLQIK